jgi:hypothetical protein
VINGFKKGERSGAVARNGSKGREKRTGERSCCGEKGFKTLF